MKKDSVHPQKLNLLIVLVVVCAALTPLLGGQIYTTVTSIPGGFGAALTAILDGPDLPSLSHLLLFLPLAIAVIWRLTASKVVSFPRYGISFLVMLFGGLLLLSFAESKFPGQSLRQLLGFVAYIVAFVAGFACLGRKEGPRLAIYAFAIGAGIEGMIGIREWEASRAVDPTWRIFANWSNPNALAGVLLLGAFAALAMTFDRQRLIRFIGILVFGVSTFALFLTQSRGGSLALVVGLIVGGILLLFKARKDASKGDILALFAAFALAAILIFGAVQSTRKAGSTAVGSRLTSASSSGQQSVQFRLNLWKSSVKIMKNHPGGVGIGAFGNYSGEPGLVTETKLAHDNLLQIGAEASPVASICLIALFCAWVIACLRGKWEQRNRTIPLIFIISALSALCVDGIFESNLYFFGTGIAAFLLMGIGLQLAPDGCSPEITPSYFRFGVGFASVVTVLGLGWFGATEWFLARLHYSLNSTSYSQAAEFAEGAANVNFLNSESRYILGLLDQNPADSVAAMRSACRLDPNTKYLRALANSLAAIGDSTGAETTFDQALAIAPNDLLTLRSQLRFEISSGNKAKANSIAIRMISIESDPIFKVRALSELVPLESIDARRFLVSQSNSPVTKADLLAGALSIESDYANQTVPALVDYFKKYGSLNWGPATGKGALKNLDAALNDANQLLTISEKQKDAAGIAEAKSCIDLFQSKIAELESLHPTNDEPLAE